MLHLPLCDSYSETDTQWLNRGYSMHRLINLLPVTCAGQGTRCGSADAAGLGINPFFVAIQSQIMRG